MKFEQLGIIVFFGILIPGAYLTVFLLLAFAALLELFGIPGHANIFVAMSQYALLSSTAFVFISYLLGIVIRLFAVRSADRASVFFLRVICRKKGVWLDEAFPFPQTLKAYFAANGMASVTELMEQVNQRYNNSETGYFNYCKLFIEANNETLAKQIQEDEANMRFLAGVFFALLVSSGVGLLFSVLFLLTHQPPFFQLLYIVLTVLSLALLSRILRWFRVRRLTEVRNVWMSVYLLLKGQVPCFLKIEKPDELIQRMKMGMVDADASTQTNFFPSYS